MKKETMTSRERVLTAMRRQQPDRVPYTLTGFAPAQVAELKRRTGQDDPTAVFGGDTRVVGISGTRLKTDYSRYFHELPPGLQIDEWGVGHMHDEVKMEDHAHFSRFVHPMLALTTVDEVRAYPLPDLEAEYRYAALPGQIAGIHKNGLAAIGSMWGTIFEHTWYMRSMELLFGDFLENAEFAQVLLDRVTAKRVVQARRYAQLGVDILDLGDDVGTQRGMMMSVEMWRQWLKPRLARVIAAGKEVNPDVLVFYHSDGDVRMILPELIEIGVDILNPVQPECMDPAEVKRLHGDRLSFWGTIGTQHTMPFGSAADVRREVQLRMETVGVGGGLLLAPTHVVEPEVPWENIVAFVDAVREFGWY